jgi:hypothetical protein
MSKPTPVSTLILGALETSALPLTRVEIGNKLPEVTKDQIRKRTNALVAAGKIVQTVSKHGVPRYAIPKGPRKSPQLIKEEKAKLIDSAELPPPTPELDVQAAYLKGYNDGIFHANRDGFNAGRKAVLKGLTKLLGIEAEILL